MRDWLIETQRKSTYPGIYPAALRDQITAQGKLDQEAQVKNAASPTILRGALMATLNFGFADSVEAFLLVCAPTVTNVTAVIRASAVWLLDV